VRSARLLIALAAAWHLSILPGVFALMDWLLGYGASTCGVPVLFPTPDLLRAAECFAHPLCVGAWLTVLLLEGTTSWVAFQWVTRRVGYSFGQFAQYWWKVLLWSIWRLPASAVAVAIIVLHYDIAMYWPLLWIVGLSAAPALLARNASRRRACCT
jgi:hypothetical protein